MPAVCLQFVLVCVFLSKTSPKRRPFLDPELRVFVFQMENLESPSPLSSFFSPFLGEEKANVWSTRHVTRREGGRLGGLELLRGFDDRFSPSCCIPNLTDSRAFSFRLSSFREAEEEQHADSGDADRHLQEERGRPQSEPYPEFTKSERESFYHVASPTQPSLETLLQVSMISEGVQTNGGLSNGYPSPPQPPLPVLHQQHQGCTLIFNDISLSTS